ncbi:hypothetical protein TKK_0015460 [Trichogramma kaykai]
MSRFRSMGAGKKSRLTSRPPSFHQEEYTQLSLPEEDQDKISYGSEKNSEEEFSISSDDKNGDEIQYEEPNFGITSTYLKKDQAVQANLFSNEMTPVGGYISEKVFKQVMERVINKLSRIEIMVQNSKEGSKEIEHDQEKSLLPRFPIKSEADINDLNYLLENSEAARKEFKTYIKRVGGKSLGDTMRASLKDIVDDTFLDSSFTWSGNTRESSEGEPLKKRAFQNEVFLKELVDAVAAMDPGYTKKKCFDAAKSWIQHCRDRLNKTANKSNNGQ